MARSVNPLGVCVAPVQLIKAAKLSEKAGGDWAGDMTQEDLEAAREAMQAVDDAIAATPEEWREKAREQNSNVLKKLKVPRRKLDTERQLREEKAEAWSKEVLMIKAQAERVALAGEMRRTQEERLKREADLDRQKTAALRRKHEAEQLRRRLELNALKRAAVEKEKEQAKVRREAKELEKRQAAKRH